MYKIIAVDDEALALKRFEHIIAKESRVELQKTFCKPSEALDYIKDNAVDIAFLDIEMPDINGLELAEKIQEIDPYVSIVFITAFDQYALEAFKAHAIGYLLKPLDLDEFSAQIDNIAVSKAPRTAKDIKIEVTKKLVVKALGSFTCYSSDAPSEPIQFRTAKTAELFALLLHHYKSPITKFFILDQLFPDMDYDKSNKLFYVSCSYLRSAFTKAGVNDVLLRENDSYRLNTSIIDCDYISLLAYYERINDLTVNELTEAVNSCSGEYLMGRTYEWAFETKPYVENLYQRIVFTLVDKIKANNTKEAIQILEKYLTEDPLREDTVSKLMELHIEDGHKENATAVYRTYESKLLEQLDTEPSPSLRALLR